MVNPMHFDNTRMYSSEYLLHTPCDANSTEKKLNDVAFIQSNNRDKLIYLIFDSTSFVYLTTRL